MTHILQLKIVCSCYDVTIDLNSLRGSCCNPCFSWNSNTLSDMTGCVGQNLKQTVLLVESPISLARAWLVEVWQIAMQLRHR